METNFIPNSVNPDLQKEREVSDLNVTEFQLWIHGGEEKLKLKREIENSLYGEDTDDTLSLEYLSYEDLYNATIKKVTQIATKLKHLEKEKNPGGNDIWTCKLYSTVSLGCLPSNHSLSTHSSMFLDVINGQGTPEQVEKFGKLAANCNIIGTYAQTELAHGTHVRGLMTRADFDTERDEFVLNTPCLEAYKWWPGGLGHTANHAMVVAQLYINGDHKGIQMFIVPIRDPETHMPLPGVDVGEVGKKLGMNGTNQGFLGLKNVRIPRTNMLMKNAQVLPNGTFKRSPADKVNYMTMVYTRCLIVILEVDHLSQAATIATRYSAVRRQSPINADDVEPQIIDHVTQQMKLFPEISKAIAYRLCAKHMLEIYDQTVREINVGVFDQLQELHILSSALKVLSTTDACKGIENLRLACGGHGYLVAANFGNIYSNAVAAYTYEGENTVLLIQIGRYLIKMWSQYAQGKKLVPSVAYLEEANYKNYIRKWDGSWESIIKALKLTAAKKIRIAHESVAKYMAKGQTQGEAANNSGIELIQAAELHGRQFVAEIFHEQVTGVKHTTRSVKLNSVLENLLELFLVEMIFNHLNDILRFVHLTEADINALQQRLKEALKKIRPDAVAICDGFDYHDKFLNSVLGCYDGNVYQRLFDSAKKSPLNQKPVPTSFETHLKPLLKSKI